MGTSAKGDNLMSNTAAAANKAVSDVFATLVDELGLIKAQIAELEKTEKAIKAVLIQNKQTTYAGDFYDASVSYDVPVAEFVVKAHKKTTVRVTAKK